MIKSQNWWYVVKILSITGIALAIYLYYSYATRPTFQPCYINSKVNCDAVIKGPVSLTFGIPTSLYGLVGYVVILFAAIYKKKKLLLGMSLFGLLFCLRITFIEIFILKVICPVCLTCQLVMLAVFYYAVRLYLRKKIKH